MSQGWRAGRILAGPSGRSSRAVRAGCAGGTRAERGPTAAHHPARTPVASVRGAVLAATEEVDLVSLDGEAARRLLLAAARATEPVEDAIAAIAPEVVVVLHAGALVTRRFSRQFHLGNRFLIQEALERSVHRGHPQPRRRGAGRAEDLGRTQRSARILEHTVNGLALRRRSFHETLFSS